MDILAIGEGLFQTVDPGHMRGQPQFDLRIVSGEQDIAAFRHKGLADGAPDLGADRDVLQIGIGR